MKKSHYFQILTELGKHFLDGVDTFDVRIWIIAVAIVISTLLILGVATCCLFYKEYAVNLATQAAAAAAAHRDLDGEHIELMPNIILNPGYDFHPLDLQQDLPDENSNDTTAPHRLNNNSVIYPVRVWHPPSEQPPVTYRSLTRIFIVRRGRERLATHAASMEFTTHI